MSIQYARAEKGKEFRPTKRGKLVGRIAHKFDDTYYQSKQYRKSVPKRWVSDGYVEEVDIEGGSK